MPINRGKDFEKVIKESFEKVPNTTVIRLHDQTNGFMGSNNPCDFLIYSKPYLYAIECKSVHGNVLSINSNDPKKKYGLISNYQWQSLSEMSKVKGVVAGIICWWIDRDVTKFISMDELDMCKRNDYKSVRFDHEPFTTDGFIDIPGDKKRVFFDYDMTKFLDLIRIAYERDHEPVFDVRSKICRK